MSKDVILDNELNHWNFSDVFVKWIKFGKKADIRGGAH